MEQEFELASGEEKALQLAVATVEPVTVTIIINLQSFIDYADNVYDDPNCTNGMLDLDHTVLVVGYGSTAKVMDYWIITNSWGTNWGNKSLN